MAAPKMPSTQAYEQWAATYDTDGNALQALDDIQLDTLIPYLTALLAADTKQRGSSGGPLIVDLGCGTGRCTSRFAPLPNARVVGLDASPAMLARARERCAQALAQLAAPGAEFDFATFDMLATTDEENSNDAAAAAAPLPAPLAHSPALADAVVSTLVMEHVPLERFFAACASLTRPGGLLLATNMHSDMGARSGAGFVDARSGAKVRVEGFAHAPDEMMQAAAEAGFEALRGPEERACDEEVLGQLGERGKKWLGVNMWMGAVWRLKEA